MKLNLSFVSFIFKLWHLFWDIASLNEINFYYSNWNSISFWQQYLKKKWNYIIKYNADQLHERLKRYCYFNLLCTLLFFLGQYNTHIYFEVKNNVII